MNEQMRLKRALRMLNSAAPFKVASIEKGIEQMAKTRESQVSATSIGKFLNIDDYALSDEKFESLKKWSLQAFQLILGNDAMRQAVIDMYPEWRAKLAETDPFGPKMVSCAAYCPVCERATPGPKQGFKFCGHCGAELK